MAIGDEGELGGRLAGSLRPADAALPRKRRRLSLANGEGGSLRPLDAALPAKGDDGYFVVRRTGSLVSSVEGLASPEHVVPGAVR